MSSTSAPSIELDFLMQGVAEREKEREREASTSGTQKGKEGVTQIQTSFKIELEKNNENFHPDIALTSKFLE